MALNELQWVMFSHSHQEKIWQLRDTPARKKAVTPPHDRHKQNYQRKKTKSKTQNKWRHWFTSCLFTGLSGEEINSPVDALFSHHTTQRDAWKEGWAGHTHRNTHTDVSKHAQACTETSLHLDYSPMGIITDAIKRSRRRESCRKEAAIWIIYSEVHLVSHQGDSFFQFALFFFPYSNQGADLLWLAHGRSTLAS